MTTVIMPLIKIQNVIIERRCLKSKNEKLVAEEEQKLNQNEKSKSPQIKVTQTSLESPTSPSFV